jgi:hypothetical protein
MPGEVWENVCGKKMQSLLERLTDTARPDPSYVEPRYSRKTKRVTLAVHLGDLAVEVSLPIKHLDLAIDRACAESDGIGVAQSLLDELLHAWQKYGHILDGKKRPRGSQTRRRMILIDLKYASAWAHHFLTREWEKPLQDRYRPLQRAAEQFKKVANRECHDPIEMAAFLVFNAYKVERLKHKIKTPWNDWSDFDPENYARRYIKTDIGNRVHSRVQKTPALLIPIPRRFVVIRDGDNFQEAWKIACQNGRCRNPLLQKLFSSWSDA